MIILFLNYSDSCAENGWEQVWSGSRRSLLETIKGPQVRSWHWRWHVFKRQHQQALLMNPMSTRRKIIPRFLACDAVMVPFAIMGKTREEQVGELGPLEFPVAHVTFQKPASHPVNSRALSLEFRRKVGAEWPLGSRQQAF